MTPCAELLTELEPSPVKHVTSALGQRAEVKGMGKAMFKGADGEMVGLKNVLWVPNLAANLISVRQLQKAGMDTSSKGAKTYTARLGERILWDLHEYRDVYNKMWQIPVVLMPKERQVAANISTKGKAVGSGDGANDRAKEIESKKCNLGGASKLGEHKESGAAAKEQHKGQENPKAATEEEYRESMWGTNAGAAFSNPTSATGECDWLTLHQRMGHVALPILQQLVKIEMVAGIRVKGEPDEILGSQTCMQAKFTHYPFSSSEATAKAPLDEVVMDVVGLLKLRAAGVAETVKTDWLPMVERQQDRLVKSIRTDRWGEFLSKEFLLWMKKNGIRHSLNMPYSPAMNGIAERANQTITETARGLLIEAGLHDYFWPDAVRSACVAKNRALTHVGADKWLPYVEWIGRKPKVDMLRVFRCMCMALVPKHLHHNKLGAKAIWAVHFGMAQNSKGWLLWDPFTKKFLVSRDCKFMENLMYKDWKAENEAKIGRRFGEVKSSGLEHVELSLELSSTTTTTRQSSLLNGGEEAKDAEEEEEEVQQVSERAPTLPSRTTSAPRIRVTPQQRHESLHFPAAEEEGRGKRRIQAPNRLTYDALGKPAKSALAGAALIVGNDEESDYDECAFAFFSLVEMPGEPATLKEALESCDAEEWKKSMDSELKSIEKNGTWELVELPEGRKAITSKWLFKIKSDADGKIERYKSRLVAKGYQQKEKVDYKELFALVIKPTTLRTLLAGAAIKGWVVKQMGVTTAFLNGILEEEIFMAQLEGFDDGSGRLLKLKKALYGLKQAPGHWYLKLCEVLEEIGFTPLSADHSFFMLGEGEQRSFMVVNVDDILIFSPSSDLGAWSGCAEPGGEEPGGAEPEGVEPRGAEREGVEPGGAESEGAESRGAEPRGAAWSAGPAGASPRLSSQQLREWLVWRACLRSGATGPGGAGDVEQEVLELQLELVVLEGLELEAVAQEALELQELEQLTLELEVLEALCGRDRTSFPCFSRFLGSLLLLAFLLPSSVHGLISCSRRYCQPPILSASALLAPSLYTEQSGGLTERREPACRLVSPVRTSRRVPRSRPPPVPGTHAMALRPYSVPLRVPLPAPPESSLPEVHDPESDRARAASPTVSLLLATAVTDPSFESALVAELLDFAAAYRLDYTTALVAESMSANPPSVGGECALGTDVLEDRQEDRSVLQLLYLILLPCCLPLRETRMHQTSQPRALTGPYSSQFQAAMDAKMASWKSTGTYVDEVPPPGANIVDGMWIFRVKRPPGSSPAFKARYYARGFKQRQGVDIFLTFSPTPKMTTLWVLLHVAAQHDSELHSLDFSTAFLQGTQWSLRRPVYSLRQAPREWHDTLRTTLAALGFAPSTADPSPFLHTDTSLPSFYVLVYIDDLVFAIADTEALTIVKSKLQKRLC
ncbi:unnamed protein product [Closterium sp. NIES-54]